MGPAGHVHQAFAAHLIVGPVAVALQPAGKVAQEALRPIPLAAQPEVEHHRAARLTVLPQVGLMVLAPPIVHLHPHGRFIGLKVAAA
jgi:hypothetical protein